MADETLMTAWVEFKVMGDTDVVQKAKRLYAVLETALPKSHTVTVDLDFSAVSSQVDKAIREIDRIGRHVSSRAGSPSSGGGASSVRQSVESMLGAAVRNEVSASLGLVGGSAFGGRGGGSDPMAVHQAQGPHLGLSGGSALEVQKRLAEQQQSGSGGKAAAVGFFGTVFDELGKGSSIRRAFARGLSESFGDSMVGAAIAGFGGAVAAAVMMPLIWKIGDLISGAVGAGFRYREASGRVGAMSASPHDKRDWDEMRVSGDAYWSVAPGGFGTYPKVIEEFQKAGISPQDAAKPIDQLFAIELAERSNVEGTPGRAKQLAKIMRGASGGDIAEFLSSSWYLEQAVRESAGPNSMFGRGTEDQKRLALHNAALQGKIGRQGVIGALGVGAGRAAGVAESQVDTESDWFKNSPFSIKGWKRAAVDVSRAFSGGRFAEDFFSGTTDTQTKLKDRPGFQGPPPSSKFSFGAEPVGTPSYHFTSVAGLADQMQMMMSQQVDVGPDMLNELKDINRKTPEPGGGKPNPSSGGPQG